MAGVPTTGKTEQYDGTSWTEVADIPTATNGVSGFGTSSLAVSAGGGDEQLDHVFEWTVGQNIKTITD